MARQLNHPPAVVTKHLKVFAAVPEDLHGRIGEGEGLIGFSIAYSLARAFEKLGDVPAVRTLAEQVMAGRFNRFGVEAEVNKLLGGKKAKGGLRPVKARTARGLCAVIPPLDYESVLGELNALCEAVRKAAKHSLPLSSLPSLLKGA